MNTGVEKHWLIMNLLNVKEVAEIFGVRPKTIYQWAELGQIPCIKLNGALRFDLDDIQAWLNRLKKASHIGYNSLTQARGPRKGGGN